MVDRPGPALLQGLVDRLGYKPGWSFKISGPLGRFLCVNADTPDSAEPTRIRRTQHMFEAPAFADEHAAARWVLQCLLLCEQHETCEFFTVDGTQPFFPHHQDEGSPYELVDRWEQLHGTQPDRGRSAPDQEPVEADRQGDRARGAG